MVSSKKKVDIFIDNTYHFVDLIVYVTTFNMWLLAYIRLILTKGKWQNCVRCIVVVNDVHNGVCGFL